MNAVLLGLHDDHGRDSAEPKRRVSEFIQSGVVALREPHRQRVGRTLCLAQGVLVS